MSKDKNIIEVTPLEAYKQLAEDLDAQLIDVRSSTELQYIGYPDLKDLGKQLLHIPLYAYPEMKISENFIKTLREEINDFDTKIYFICRTGGRSYNAASLAKDLGYKKVYNVLNGFEGEHNKDKQRGKLNGWKADNLPWEQA